MAWKDWAYWLKGLIIGLLVMIVGDLVGIVLYISTLPGCTGSDCVLNRMILITIPSIALLILPVLGLIIGWIIDKVKSK